MSKLRQDADAIIQAAITAAQPDEAVRKALEGRDFGSGRCAGCRWQGCLAYGDAASPDRDFHDTGIVITKYNHSKGPIANFTIREAGHPIPDEQLYRHPAGAGPRQRADRTGHRAVPAFRRRFRFV